MKQLVKDGALVEETIPLKSIADIGEGMDKITAFAERVRNFV